MEAVALQVIADTSGDQDCDGDNCDAPCVDNGQVICSPLVAALQNARVLVSTVVKDHTVPTKAMVDETLQGLQQGEAALRQDLHALQNAPSPRVPGQLEAYLGLKHSLTTLLANTEQLEAHVGHLQKLLESHPGGAN
jgi:hypothetical protein